MQKAFGKKSVILLFIFPAFLIYTAFVIVSIIWAGYYSFFDWGGVGEKVFVGLKNYIELVTQDEVFRATIGHTLVYTVINVAIQVFGGLLFAILLSRIKKRKSCFTDSVLYSGSYLFCSDLPDFYKVIISNSNRYCESGIIIHRSISETDGVDFKSSDFTVCNSFCRSI